MRDMLDGFIRQLEEVDLKVGTYLMMMRAWRKDIDLRVEKGAALPTPIRRNRIVAPIAEPDVVIAASKMQAASVEFPACADLRPEAEVIRRGKVVPPPTPPPRRMPSLQEHVASGMAETNGRRWFEHYEAQLRDGRWEAGIVAYEDQGSKLIAQQVFAPEHQAYWPTRDEARRVNVALARRWYTDASGGSTPGGSTPPAITSVR